MNINGLALRLASIRLFTFYSTNLFAKSHLLLHWTIKGPTCTTEESLVGPVPNGQMTASSVNHPGVPAHYSRIDFSGAWCATFGEIGSSPLNMWIQVGKSIIYFDLK